MGNPLTPKISKGTIGEILVQLRLLEYGVQAAPPIKDSGNDLIAIKGEKIKFIQVKTGKRLGKLPKIYHIVALVKLEYSESGDLSLDKSEIYIIKKGESIKKKKRLTKGLANTIWGI